MNSVERFQGLEHCTDWFKKQMRRSHIMMMQLIKTTQRVVKRAAFAAAVCLLALPGVSRADSIANWYINGNLTETWTSTSPSFLVINENSR